MKITHISDTHNHLNFLTVPDADVLIHSGDATNMGTEKEFSKFVKDMAALPHKNKIFVSGNHDWICQRNRKLAETMLSDAGVIYLQDSEVIIDGIKFYGSPWTPAFCDWAFNLYSKQETEDIFNLIPSDTDVLITHGPPAGILDTVEDIDNVGNFINVGSPELAATVSRIKPKAHLFGHIHFSAGNLIKDGVLYVNGAICDESNQLVNRPMVFEI